MQTYKLLFISGWIIFSLSDGIQFVGISPSRDYHELFPPGFFSIGTDSYLDNSFQSTVTSGP